MAKVIYTAEEQARLDALAPEKRTKAEFAVWMFEASWRSLRAGSSTDEQLQETFGDEMFNDIKAMADQAEDAPPSRVDVRLTRDEKLRVKAMVESGQDEETARLDVEAGLLIDMAQTLAPVVAARPKRYPPNRYQRIKTRLREFEISVGKDIAQELREIAFEARNQNACIHVARRDDETYLYDFEAATWHLLETFEENVVLNTSTAKCGVGFLGDGTKDNQLMRVYLVFQLSCTEPKDHSICRTCLPDLKHMPELNLSQKEELQDA